MGLPPVRPSPTQIPTHSTVFTLLLFPPIISFKLTNTNHLTYALHNLNSE
jgi:hypothetical protein